ncbi:MAG: YidC/Oxa1 family insertase periplasmic-domain containing protein [Planctomycetaceae bacterium]
MEQRNFFLKAAIVIAFGYLWMLMAPRLFPGLFPPRPKAPPRAPVVAEQEHKKPEGMPEEGALVAGDEGNVDEGQPQVPDQFNEHPHRTIELGSLDPKSEYFLQVTVDSAGATIPTAQFNDPRYGQADNRDVPLKVLGDDQNTSLKTLQMSIEKIDDQLKKHGTSLAEVDWEVIPGESADGEVSLRYRAPDGTLEVRKHFRLNKGNTQERDQDYRGYLVDVDLEVVNLTDQPQELVYKLQGPVGLPLENEETSRAFIEVKVGALETVGDTSDVSAIQQTAGTIVKQTDEAIANNDPEEIEDWKSPLKYVGVDVQYFAALLFPKGNQWESRYFAEARPVVVNKNPINSAWSDVSVELHSEKFEITPDEPLKHSFQLFLGPKRSDLLAPLDAGGVQTLGWFSVISRGMLSILDFFHTTMMAPYGLAIILLTVVVRACLFPVSRKMAQNQQRMKELQPKMQEIRTKYKDDQEKMAQAYREFMAKNGFNPLAGCLPMFLQLPIFLGLYQALLNSVDLRLARFLWVDNLVAPDQLFAFGFAIPIVGWKFFNLLPLITVALFAFQQKMFMPPAETDEQKMQQQMMKYMNVFMLYIFYTMPAGLCVYFITSSSWGIIERKLLVLTGGASTDAAADQNSSEGGNDSPGRGGSGPSGGRGDGPKEEPPKPPGFLQRLMEAADEAKNSSNGTITKRDNPNKDKGGNRKKSKGRR